MTPDEDKIFQNYVKLTHESFDLGLDGHFIIVRQWATAVRLANYLRQFFGKNNVQSIKSADNNNMHTVKVTK